MLKFKNVTKRFGKKKALDGATFEVKKGEFVFLVGPSGSGKTTILKLLLGEYSPSSGEIVFDKKKVTSLSNKQLPFLRQKVGAVFQDFKLLPERTVRENVETALAIKGVDQSKWKAKVDLALKAVGVRDKAASFPAQLSGGEIQRVAIARALVIGPRLVFADEPTGNLDWETAESIIELLDDINKEGVTVVVATHHRSIVEKYKHRVIKLEKGTVVK